MASEMDWDYAIETVLEFVPVGRREALVTWMRHAAGLQAQIATNENARLQEENETLTAQNIALTEDAALCIESSSFHEAALSIKSLHEQVATLHQENADYAADLKAAYARVDELETAESRLTRERAEARAELAACQRDFDTLTRNFNAQERQLDECRAEQMEMKEWGQQLVVAERQLAESIGKRLQLEDQIAAVRAILANTNDDRSAGEAIEEVLDLLLPTSPPEPARPVTLAHEYDDGWCRYCGCIPNSEAASEPCDASQLWPKLRDEFVTLRGLVPASPTPTKEPLDDMPRIPEGAPHLDWYGPDNDGQLCVVMDIDKWRLAGYGNAFHTALRDLFESMWRTVLKVAPPPTEPATGRSDRCSIHQLIAIPPRDCEMCKLARLKALRSPVSPATKDGDA